MDLTARHPRTGELLSTVKFMVQTLAAPPWRPTNPAPCAPRTWKAAPSPHSPEYTAADPDTPTPELPVTLDMPGTPYPISSAVDGSLSNSGQGQGPWWAYVFVVDVALCRQRTPSETDSDIFDAIEKSLS
ncbi:hypothetical protein AB0I82_08845 [Streptomyces sp. NPDC050315]|uniref:hypothetical protein n=1 Tax=Streptomyces sp. NPDC050315 TaxID=3155039 RepID=UPI00341CD54C